MTEDKNHKVKPHGVTTISFEAQELDLKSAIESIKKQLSQDFLKNNWSDSLKDAIRASSVCENFRQSDWTGSPYTQCGAQISACWFSIKLLNVLWDLLFGRTVASAPWHDTLWGLASHQANGSADCMMSINEMKHAVFMNPKGVEEALLHYLGKCFPMKILMPKVITPGPREGTSQVGVPP
ncbi:hypothetical protein F5B19DRAFT_445242 [Rostrohypoxylon terebratum]|nr:hypothetical protein F5B19DRAFT_445242 [Rostrohypoxylon terebratum]